MATIYTSQAQCSEVTGTPIEIIRYAAKHPDSVGNKNGAKYANRINWDKLSAWIEENKETIEIAIQDKSLADGVTLHDLEKIEKIRKLKNFNRSKDKAFINRKLVLQTVESVTARLTDALRQKFEFETPPKCAGGSEIEIKKINKKVLDELLGNFARAFVDWKTASDVQEISEDEMQEDE